jgi:hypothetical protein
MAVWLGSLRKRKLHELIVWSFAKQNSKLSGFAGQQESVNWRSPF